jgi:hypothetical protein
VSKFGQQQPRTPFTLAQGFFSAGTLDVRPGALGDLDEE